MNEVNYINTNLQPFLLANINYMNVGTPDSANDFNFTIPENVVSMNTFVPNKAFVGELFINVDPYFRTHLFSHATRCLMYSKFLYAEYKYLQNQANVIMNMLKKEYKFR